MATTPQLAAPLGQPLLAPQSADSQAGARSQAQAQMFAAGQLSATEDCKGDSISSIYKGVLHSWGELVKVVCCPFLCCQCGPSVVVEQGWVGVLTRFGVFEKVLPPGMYVINCMSQRVQRVCMKMQTVEIPRQAAMTRDNLKVQVDAVAFVTVVDPVRASFRVQDYLHAVKTLTASMLLRVMGEHDLAQIFRDRAGINEQLTLNMQEKTAGWGVQVAGVEMRDITIPDAMQRAMAQIAEANREAEAKVIVAEGQRRAAFVFAEAAEAMERQPMSLQLQWFETLRQIAVEKNSTVIVPDSVIGPLSEISRSARAAGASASVGPIAASALAAARATESRQPVVPDCASVATNASEQHWMQVGSCPAEKDSPREH